MLYKSYPPLYTTNYQRFMSIKNFHIPYSFLMLYFWSYQKYPLSLPLTTNPGELDITLH